MYFLINVRRPDWSDLTLPGITTVVPIQAASWDDAIALLRTEFRARDGWIVDPPAAES